MLRAMFRYQQITITKTEISVINNFPYIPKYTNQISKIRDTQNQNHKFFVLTESENIQKQKYLPRKRRQFPKPGNKT